MTEGILYPARVAAAPGGGVYVTDPPMKLVASYDGAGAFVGTFPIAGGAVGVAVHPDGRVFLSRNDGSVGVYSAAFALLGTVNPAPMALTGANDLAFDPVAMELYTVDSKSHKVLVFTESAPGTWTLARAWGMEGTGLGMFSSPQAIAVDSTLGRVIVTDADNFRVQVFDQTGILLFKFGYRTLFLPTSDTAWFARSEGIAVDSCGNIYIVDALMGTLRTFSNIGKELSAQFTPAVSYGTAAGQLRVPCDVVIDPTGLLYIANTNNNAVEVFNVTCSAVASADVNYEEPRGPDKSAKLDRRGSDGRTVVAPTAVAEPRFPDNPLDIVTTMQAGEYREEFDFNRDRRIDATDLEIAVFAFGAGTADDFLDMAEGTVAGHPSLAPPHILDLPNRCGRCHSMNGAPGGMLSAAGQENLCLSCHSAGKIAGHDWVGPSSDTNSHPWGIMADAGSSLGPPAGSDLLLHLDNGMIRCGTCHEPHESVEGGEYMRYSLYHTEPVASPPSPPPPAAPWQMTVMNPTLCGQCHSEVEEWKHAGHSHTDADPFIHYDWSLSNRAACRQCHSGFGYIDFTEGLTSAQQRGNFRVIDCLVCHSTHGAEQEADLLRIYDNVTLPADPVNFPGGFAVTDAEGSATCMACHNGRAAPPVQNSNATPISTPHYMLGGVMLEGINAVTFGNTSLTNSAHSTLVGCTDCHMAPGPTTGPGAGKVGGHTFNLKVHDPLDPDFGFENVVGACQGCHVGLTTLNRPALDYDGDGVAEGVQDEVQGLLNLVLAQITARGAVQLPGFPYWNLTPVATADRILVKNAIWNWQYVNNSGDLGVKNTSYAVGVLQLTYQQLAGGVVPGAILRYVP